MKCNQCGTPMVESNITFEYIIDDIFYTRYYCFNCDTLYECSSQSGDMIEENLDKLGELEYH